MRQFITHLRQNRQSILYKTLFQISAVVILPIMVLIIVLCSQSNRIISFQIQEIDENLLERTKENFELAFEQIYQQTLLLVNSDSITTIAFYPETREWPDLIACVTALDSAVAYNEYIHSAYMYSAGGRYVLTSQKRYYPIDCFYDADVWVDLYDKAMDGAQWTDIRTLVHSDGTKRQAVSLVMSSPHPVRRKTGAVVINVDLDAMAASLLSNNSRRDTTLLVLDRNLRPAAGLSDVEENLDVEEIAGHVAALSTGSEKASVGGVESQITYMYSEKLDLYFACVTQYGVYSSRFQHILISIAVCALLITLIALLLAARVSLRTYAPVKELLYDIVGKRDLASENEYEVLGREYHHIQDQNAQLCSEISCMRPLLSEHFFRRLLWGYTDSGDIPITAQQPDFQENSFIVFMAHNLSLAGYSREDPDNFLVTQRNITRILSQDKRFKPLCIETEPQILTIILNFAAAPSAMDMQRAALEQSEKIRQLLRPEDWVFGFGHCCENVEELPHSYQNAARDLKYRLFQIENADVSQEDGDRFLSALESRMKTALVYTQDFRPILKEISGQILQDASGLSAARLRRISVGLLNHILEAVIESKVDSAAVFNGRNLFEELSPKDDPADIFSWFDGVCQQAAEAIIQSTENQSRRKVNLILTYIDQHLDEDISLQDISDYINLSSSYVSRIFKEYTGKNFVDYLNGCRIERAKHLLTNTQMRIKEIGFRCGFNNMQSFVRTFRKYTEKTPSAYRNAGE